MSAVDEIGRADGIIPVTPRAVGELVSEIARLRDALDEITQTGSGDDCRDIARAALTQR